MISDKMVDWLKKNIVLKDADFYLQPDERAFGVNWRRRFQDFTDDMVLDQIGDKRDFATIIFELSHKAFLSGAHEIEHHISGFKDEEGWQKFLAEFKRLQNGNIEN